MKYVSFKKDGQIRIGVRTSEGIIDLNAAAAVLSLDVPGSMEELIASGETGRKQVEAILRVVSNTKGFPSLDEDHLDFLPVVSVPEKIICVGLNYRRHAQESGMSVPDAPVYFSKYANSLIGHDADVVLPEGVIENDYEVELAVIIG
ncbi:MAG: fumarylacetoacetate hydrolase family protein, partial [Limnochordia bacterium]